VRRLAGELLTRCLGCSPKCNNTGDIFRTGANAALLATSADERIPEMHILAPAHDGADTLWSSDLVCRNGQKIGPQGSNIARNSARALDRINVEEAGGRVHDGCRLRHRLHHAGLIIGQHE
jgi:hypothetical protein